MRFGYSGSADFCIIESIECDLRGIGMNAVDKFEQFEWLTHGITAKSPNFEPQAHGTGEKPLNYEDRLGAIASMETQLAKSVTALIVFDGKC